MKGSIISRAMAARMGLTIDECAPGRAVGYRGDRHGPDAEVHDVYSELEEFLLGLIEDVVNAPNPHAQLAQIDRLRIYTQRVWEPVK